MHLQTTECKFNSFKWIIANLLYLYLLPSPCIILMQFCSPLAPISCFYSLLSLYLSNFLCVCPRPLVLWDFVLQTQYLQTSPLCPAHTASVNICPLTLSSKVGFGVDSVLVDRINVVLRRLKGPQFRAQVTVLATVGAPGAW